PIRSPSPARARGQARSKCRASNYHKCSGFQAFHSNAIQRRRQLPIQRSPNSSNWRSNVNLPKARIALALRFAGIPATTPFGLGANAAKGPQISIKDFEFAPMSLTVKAGTPVTWKNLDGEPHTVVSEDGAFRSTALDEGDSFSFTFTKPGT